MRHCVLNPTCQFLCHITLYVSVHFCFYSVSFSGGRTIILACDRVPQNMDLKKTLLPLQIPVHPYISISLNFPHPYIPGTHTLSRRRGLFPGRRSPPGQLRAGCVAFGTRTPTDVARRRLCADGGARGGFCAATGLLFSQPCGRWPISLRQVRSLALHDDVDLKAHIYLSSYFFFLHLLPRGMEEQMY